MSKPKKQVSPARNVAVLMSGGADSACVLWFLINKGIPLNIYVIFADYNQATHNEESMALDAIVKYCNEYIEQNGLPISIECLSTSADVGRCRLKNDDIMFPGRNKAYVPYRNLVLLSLALSVTEEFSPDTIYMGVHNEDECNRFPDCSVEFSTVMNDLIHRIYDRNTVISFPLHDVPNSKEDRIASIPSELVKLCFSGYGNTLAAPDSPEVTAAPNPVPQEAEKIHTATGINEAITSLMTKEHEPLIVRKYMQYGFPLYVGMICGASLDDLDTVVLEYLDANTKLIRSNSIQDKRNICGMLTDHLRGHYYHKAEGVAVCWYVDKMFISSLYGDFMTHYPCKAELYSIINTLPHI